MKGKIGTKARVWRDMENHELLAEIVGIEDANRLRQVARIRFLMEANLKNRDAHAPFIYWPVINAEVGEWLPVAVGKLVLAENPGLADSDRVALMAIPAAASCYVRFMGDNRVIPSAVTPQVLKASQARQMGVSLDGAIMVPVPSYTKNRKSDGSRGVDPIYLVNPDEFSGIDTVVVVDDALAEGASLWVMAESLKELGVKRVVAGVPMSKDMQGGMELLRTKGSPVDKVSALVNVVNIDVETGAMTLRD